MQSIWIQTEQVFSLQIYATIFIPFGLIRVERIIFRFRPRRINKRANHKLNRRTRHERRRVNETKTRWRMRVEKLIYNSFPYSYTTISWLTVFLSWWFGGPCTRVEYADDYWSAENPKNTQSITIYDKPLYIRRFINFNWHQRTRNDNDYTVMYIR